MRIVIIGAGAMGSLFGGMLARAGEDVVFVEKWQDHVDALEERGLQMRFGDDAWHAEGRATTDVREAGTADLLMIWSKAYDTAAAIAEAAPAIGPDTIVCTLQNGLGNIEAIERHVPQERIVYGVTGIGAILLGPGEIQLTEGAWTGGGVTWIGARTAAARPVVERVGELLNRAKVTTEVRDDIDALVWNKLAMATAMSSVTAVTRLRMGAVMDQPGTRQLLVTLTEEIVAVANGKGIALDAEEAVRRNMHIYDQGAEHLTSMVQDVIAQRRTEVASLTRAIADEGRAVGVPTPACETLASLIEAIEAHYDVQLLGTHVTA
jgi:2-dehydropantoate 2-reductase